MVDAGRIILSLVAVLGALIGTTWLSRRSKGAGRGGLRVVSRVGVSKGSSLLVVSVGSRMMLVGATEGSLRLLSEIDPADLDGSPAEVTDAAAPDPAPAGAALPQLPQLPAGLAPVLPSSPGTSGVLGSTAVAAALAAPAPAHRSTGGPWTGLVRNLQRMTLRTAPTGSRGPFHARKR